MITRDVIKTYINRCLEIRRLSSSVYKSDVDDFVSTMQENFKKIGELARENKAIYDEINKMLESDYELTNTDEENLVYLSSNLNDIYTMENLDLMLDYKICEKLLSNARKKNDINKMIVELDRMVSSAYALSNMAKRISAVNKASKKYSSQGLLAAKEIVKALDESIFKTIDDDSKFLVLVQSRFANALYEDSEDKELYKEVFELLENSEKLYYNQFYLDNAKNYDWGYHMMRVYQYFAILEEPHKIIYIDDNMKQIIADKVKLLCNLFEDDNSYYSYIEKTELDILYYRSLYHINKISKEEYKKRMYEVFKARSNSNDHGDIFPNLLAPYEYVCTIDKKHITENDKLMLERFYSGISSYIFNFNTAGSLSYMLEYVYYILDSFIEVPGGISFKSLCLECLASLHMPTYVHSIMVGRIATCICSYLLKENRELFLDVFKDKSDEFILDFTNNAGVMHDFGKIPVIDTVFIYGRKLTDDEFLMVKTHAELSYYFLNKHESTRRYATIAYNHHMFYDKTKGYPLKPIEDGYKIITDIITIADCMDAATDIIGRSYNRGKTLDEFKEELIKESGTRYNDKIVELFNNKDMIEDLNYLLTERRNDTYKSSYITLKTLQEKAKMI